jgi:HEAT repeat protein
MGAYSVLYQNNKKSDCDDDTSPDYIRKLISQLNATAGLSRLQAREKLICIGQTAVPELEKALSKDDPQLRWQVVKVLEDIKDPHTIPALVELLMDDSTSVRWAASNALLKYRRQAISPLLEALVCDSDSLWLRQGAHHFLHRMKDIGELTRSEETVFSALEDIEPSVSVPWAAEKALEAMRVKKI